MCPVDSSRSPCQVLEESSSCPRIRSHVGRGGRNRGTTRGRLEDECGTTTAPPQSLPVHPRVTPWTSPRRRPLSPAGTGEVHRFHTTYYYLDFSPRELFFKTGCVETRSGRARFDPARSTPERRQGEGGDPFLEHIARDAPRVSTKCRTPTGLVDPLEARHPKRPGGSTLASSPHAGTVWCRSPVPDFSGRPIHQQPRALATLDEPTQITTETGRGHTGRWNWPA